MRALEPEPVARYRSAAEFAAELESWRHRSLDGLRWHAAAAREGIRNPAPAGIAAAAVGLGPSSAAFEDDTVGHAVEAFVPPPIARLPPPDRLQSRPIRRRRSRRYLWAVAPLLPPLGLILLLSLATVAIIAVVGGGRSEARIPGLHEPSLLAVVPTISPSTPPSASLATQPPSPQATPEPSPEPTAAPTSAPTPVPPPAATPRPAPTSPPAPRATPAPTSAPVPGGPADTVARFYRLVAADRFDDAAALWTRAMRDRYPPEQYIDGRFAPTTAIDLRRNEVIAINRAAGTATVAVDLVEYRASGPSPRRFVGDWDLVLVDGRWLMNDPDF
jgi:cell division septation protein DedD